MVPAESASIAPRGTLSRVCVTSVPNHGLHAELSVPAGRLTLSYPASAPQCLAKDVGDELPGAVCPPRWPAPRRERSSLSRPCVAMAPRPRE
jgi:hypothetical protein